MFTWVRNDFQKSGLTFHFSEALTVLFVLLYYVLPSSWHMTFQTIFLSSPPNLLQVCWEYRCQMWLITYILRMQSDLSGCHHLCFDQLNYLLTMNFMVLIYLVYATLVQESFSNNFENCYFQNLNFLK